jgi:O-antigen/teichoic acid export membrane protein
MSAVKRAGLFLFVGQIYNIGIRFGSNLILTRLVTPEEFGIVAVANLLLLGVAVVSEVGLKQSVVRTSSEINDVFLRTVWTTQLLRGLLLAMIMGGVSAGLYFSGSSLPGVYSNELLPFIVLILAANPFIFGFESIKVALASRRLEYGKVTYIEVVAQTIGICFAIWFAYQGGGIWALIASPILTAFIQVMLGHLALGGENVFFGFNWSVFDEVFSFGKWIFLSSIIGFICYYGDQLIFAGWINETDMAMYAVAFFILGIIRALSSKFAKEVAFARLSLVQRETPEALMAEYYRLRLPVDFILLCSAGVLFVSGQSLIDFLYDDRYSSAGGILSILALSLVFERFSFVVSFFMAVGNSKAVFQISALRAATLICVLPPILSFYGVEVALYSLVFYRLFDVLLIIWLKSQYQILSVYKELTYLCLFPLGLLGGLGVNWTIEFLNLQLGVL